MELTEENRKTNTSLPLVDFPYNSHFTTIDSHKIHYIDEGPAESIPIVLLHGVPTWSYLFRKIIPGLLKEGYRVIAPDIIGFGMSEKPSSKKYYTFDIITDILSKFLATLCLENIVLMGHDWGAIFGFRLAVENDSRFSGLILCNGFLPRGDEKAHYLFSLWKFFTSYSPLLPVGKIVNMGCITSLSKQEKRAYNLPFSNNKSKIAIRILPKLLPFNNNDIITANEIWGYLQNWKKPVLTIFSSNDPITKGGEGIIQKHIPGATGYNHIILHGGHFLLEDSPDEILIAVNLFMSKI